MRVQLIIGDSNKTIVRNSSQVIEINSNSYRNGRPRSGSTNQKIINDRKQGQKPRRTYRDDGRFRWE